MSLIVTLGEWKVTLGEWIDPLQFPVLRDAKNFPTKSISGKKDTLEGIVNICDWLHYFKENDVFFNQASYEVDRIKKTFAFIQLIEGLGKLRDDWYVMTHSDNPEEKFVDLADSTGSICLSTSEASIAAHEWGIYVLKEGLNTVKTIFWGSIAFLEGISFFREIEGLRHLHGEIENVTSKKNRSIFEEKIQLGYLNVLKTVTMLAMSGIMLVSLLFEGLAHGLLFHPAVLLTLGSIWLALRYGTYFYQKMIERNERTAKLIFSNAIKA